MRHCEEVVTRSMLIEHVRDFHFDAHTNVGETAVASSWQRLGAPAARISVHCAEVRDGLARQARVSP
jgi:DNA-binding response OmpR family regulator